MLLAFVPLAVATLALLVVIAAAFSPRLDRVMAGIGYRHFGGASIERDRDRHRALRGAGIGQPYQVYVAQTRLYMVVAAVVGAVYGRYVGRLVTQLVDPGGAGAPGQAPASSGLELLIPAVSTVVLGLLGAGLVYLARWQIPSIRSNTRRRQIDATMPQTIAFIYALSRGGMAFPDVMRTLARNEAVFGQGAREMGVGVRDIDLFGADIVTAMRDISRRTPSDQFQKFTENLTSVLQSGGDIAAFLRDEYERYLDEASEQHDKILEMLSTVAEIYVTTVVAGILFLITILLVIGLTGGQDTLPIVRILTYVVIPGANVLFVAYLSEITQPLRATREDAARTDDEGVLATKRDARVRADGGRPDATIRENLGRFRAYERLERVRRALRQPIRSVVDRPPLVLYPAVPIGLLIFALHVPDILGAASVGERLRELDDALIQAALFVAGAFAVVYQYHRRRLQRMEDALPEMLERLASLNEAGVAVVTSFDRVRRSDVGALDEEVERLWRDIKWQATVEDALGRFEDRVETPAVTRVVTLITNAMRASNDIGPVLRIAAKQARADLRLKRRRRQEMLTYLVVIYVAFAVFLVIISAINFVLVPSLPETGAAAAGNQSQSFGVPSLQLGGVDTDAYQLAFFHAGVVQATFSGLVGGQMSSGSVRDGVKHMVVMLAITYGAFVLLA